MKSILGLMFRALIFICISLSALLPAYAAEDTDSFTSIDSISYFQAAIKDAEYCSMTLAGGELTPINSRTGKALSNAAMLCPDMFSWKLFAEAIHAKFWSNWADETNNWPSEPYALCKTGQSPDTYEPGCCMPGAGAKNNSVHCPVYPGSQYEATLKSLTRGYRKRRISWLAIPSYGVIPVCHSMIHSHLLVVLVDSVDSNP